MAKIYCPQFESLSSDVIGDCLRSTGVYLITNTESGRDYVGCTATGFEHRWSMHISQANRGNHHNRKLQEDWSRTESIWQFSILIICNSKDVLELEDAFIRKIQPFYNHHRRARLASAA